ncbi:hypothetical protein HPB48_023204 [Haemaphysalis longicornis]|uniref:Uncharacterized protein n=1 Tax=Haemaphysalis longicornis TaxID=44386 RepID=A0A9J6H5Q3_HAELO|nr:hypothetical protein HPB48_023204 [Haemaphysalis longicornis]
MCQKLRHPSDINLALVPISLAQQLQPTAKFNMHSLHFLQTNLDHTRAATPHLVDFVEADHIDMAFLCVPYARGSTVLGEPPNWLRFLHLDTPRRIILIPLRKFDVFPHTVSPYVVALRLQNQKSSMLLIATYAAPSVPMDFILYRIDDVL